MLKNDLDSFPECLKSTDELTDELLNEFVSACLKSEESNKNLNEDFCITPEMYYELEFNTKKKRRWKIIDLQRLRNAMFLVFVIYPN